MYQTPALQMCIAQLFHGCQGDRMSFDCASVNQLSRDRADKDHVDSEAEVLILCIVSIERRRLAQASSGL